MCLFIRLSIFSHFQVGLFADVLSMSTLASNVYEYFIYISQ